MGTEILKKCENFARCFGKKAAKPLAAVPDETYIKIYYRLRVGRKLNLDNPQAFTEKLQWLKLYDRKQEYTSMVDKCAAKEWIAGKAGTKYVIPNLGVYSNFEEINFGMLPERFVLKCTHNSGGVIIVNDKKAFDEREAKKKVNSWLKQNYYFFHREWVYKDVVPRIIAEEYLENDPVEGIHDYKVWCFNGEPQYIQYITGRLSPETYEAFYDCNWVKQDFSYHNPYYLHEVPKPVNLVEMLSVSRALAADIPFLRVDFYVLPDDSIRVGEMTFYPMTGMDTWHPKEMDLIMGSKIAL